MKLNTVITVYIVDDENLARERLKRLIKMHTEYQVCGEAENGELALQAIPVIQPDIVLLDIRMPGVDGLAVAERLSALQIPPAIIFCTAYDEYAIKAFNYHAIGYLLKPVGKDDFFKALGQAKQLSQLQVKQLNDQKAERAPVFLANSWKGHELISFDDIYFFKAEQKYLTVVHREGETLTDQTLKELEAVYSTELIRVHRNTLVNLSQVSALFKDGEGHHQLRFKACDHTVLISRRHVSDIKAQLKFL
ncbi:MAG: two-component system response regulator AlgR [Oleiphilaceae bacterium]|jgi:two-component system response regulator AlgR